MPIANFPPPNSRPKVYVCLKGATMNGKSFPVRKIEYWQRTSLHQYAASLRAIDFGKFIALWSIGKPERTPVLGGFRGSTFLAVFPPFVKRWAPTLANDIRHVLYSDSFLLRNNRLLTFRWDTHTHQMAAQWASRAVTIGRAVGN